MVLLWNFFDVQIQILDTLGWKKWYSKKEKAVILKVGKMSNELKVLADKHGSWELAIEEFKKNKSKRQE